MLRVALLSSASETIYALFLRACGEELWRNQIDVAAAILDENTAKKQDFLRHSVRVAKRQARCVARFWPVQYLNILAYKIAIRPSISPVSSAEEAADRDVPIH